MNLSCTASSTATSRTATRWPRPRSSTTADGCSTFDVVLANPPYSHQGMEPEEVRQGPLRPQHWGVPPQGRADYAFFQHIAKSLDPRPAAPRSCFRMASCSADEERRCAKKLVEVRSHRVRARPGPGLFYNSPMEAVVITLRRRKPEEHRGQGAVHQRGERIASGNRRSRSCVNPTSRRSSPLTRLCGQEGFATVATLGQIGEKGYSLAISLYVAGGSTVTPEEAIDIKTAVAQWRTAARPPTPLWTT